MRKLACYSCMLFTLICKIMCLSLQVAALYMCTRLIVNITQVYIPMYTLETLSLSKVGVKWCMKVHLKMLIFKYYFMKVTVICIVHNYSSMSRADFYCLMWLVYLQIWAVYSVWIIIINWLVILCNHLISWSPTGTTKPKTSASSK